MHADHRTGAGPDRTGRSRTLRAPVAGARAPRAPRALDDPAAGPRTPDRHAAGPRALGRPTDGPRARSVRAWTLAGALTAIQTAVVLGATAAVADPTPAATAPPGTAPATPAPSVSPSAVVSSTAPNQCDGIPGPAGDYCRGGGSGAPGLPSTQVITDPLGSIAKGCADAAAWIIGKLAGAVNETTQVDFANPGFLRQYAVVFAASSVLTLILWMLAVTKRAVRGARITTAVTEAIGYLWLAVFASAFTPLALYLLVSLTDSLTTAIASGTQQDTDRFLGGFAKALDPNSGLGGGPVMLIFVSLLSMAAAAVLWLELIVRAAMLYVGAILGTAVYSGLVDKALWHHVRRWAGIMMAVLMAKPVIVIVLGLSTAVSTGGQQDAFSSVLSGLAIMFLSIFASVLIYRFVPNLGDDMAQLHASRRAMTAGGGGGAQVTGTASYVKQGITAHGARPSAPTQPTASGAVSSGIAAHGSRGGSAPTTSSSTPHARNGNEG